MSQRKLWQLKKLSSGESLNEPQLLPENWGPIFGMAGFADRIGDLSWLGEAYNDIGWVIVGDAPPEPQPETIIGPTPEPPPPPAPDPILVNLEARLEALETRIDPHIAPLLAAITNLQERIGVLEEPPPAPPAPPAPVPPTPLELAIARQKELLEASDWAVLPDVPMTAGERDAWVEYRRAVREAHLQADFPNLVYWPTAPA